LTGFVSLRFRMFAGQSKLPLMSDIRRKPRSRHCPGPGWLCAGPNVRIARHPPGTVLLHLQKANGLGVPVGFTPDDVKRTSQECVPERRFWTTSQRISDQFLDAYDAGTGGGVVSCSGMAPQLRIAWRELHRPLRIGNPNA